jgi:hypothetical protein
MALEAVLTMKPDSKYCLKSFSGWKWGRLCYWQKYR